MKLEVRNGVLWIGTPETPGRTPVLGGEVCAMLSAIDAGHLDALRHYAQHGTLPPEPPVWPGCDVERCGPDWKVTRQGCLLATVGDFGAYWVAMLYPSHAFRPTSADGCWRGNTPQAAVDAARAGIAAHWGLS